MAHIQAEGFEWELSMGIKLHQKCHIKKKESSFGWIPSCEVFLQKCKDQTPAFCHFIFKLNFKNKLRVLMVKERGEVSEMDRWRRWRRGVALSLRAGRGQALTQRGLHLLMKISSVKVQLVLALCALLAGF